MKQVVQSLRTGQLSVLDVPAPILRPQGILVRNAVSLISAGTERMLTGTNLLQKARSRPDLVRKVIEKARREGALSAVKTVRERLDRPLLLGYSAAGVVIAVGAEASEFRVGDRVACAGAGYANHAELIYVPRLLAVKLPDSVSFEGGAFTTLGAIALQGIRQAEVALGHRVAVIGLGLIGQLAAQLLRASGCRVFGIDPKADRVALAKLLGAHGCCTNAEAIEQGYAFTEGHGFDVVLIAADTPSSEPVSLAGALARDRAIIVAVGAVGMHIPRKSYYEKELDFRLSRSYGPGRYDPNYEEKGRDYPAGYVRWTETRNMATFVEALANGAVKVEPLITHRVPIADAERAYEVITPDNSFYRKLSANSLGVLLTYDTIHELPQKITLKTDYPTQTAIRLGVVGAGNFASGTLLPAVRSTKAVELVGIVSGSGLSARSNADRFGFAYCASEFSELLADQTINWLAITTRHDLHAAQAIESMQAGKDVFVEKPLALTRDDLAKVLAAQQQTGRRLIVGFNRRFAPMVRDMRAFLSDHQRPLVASYRINAGAIPATHWTQDPTIGGGRIIGEACHFIDLLSYLIGAAPVRVYAAGKSAADEAIITLNFADDSVGIVIYAAGGDSSFGKERIEIIGSGKIAVLDDFRRLELIQNGKRTQRTERLRPDKGHRGEWVALIDAVQHGRETPISIAEIEATHLATFAAVESLRLRQPVEIG